ncbi:hypothetical protein DACRYDRAFT_105129 [Dacryopinax primogenitus]|uniref:DUF803-domain-containing protein n=1 Tax=Dacryopinax primogenitus (strain DJM 731) TaxID=1858805 RepID=M5G5S1_DACPD|nr:uncharacterized protein DACRYDRAFT_105129 [Dacryopinax primogenitus]EJU04064.1 hypothetical protein DACRYDRAFT_105129 [Dacryopinax primogenitus]
MDPTTTSTFSPSPSASPLPDSGIPVSVGNGLNPAVSFLIGALIILGASAMNAAGLNITKLDHVRTASTPKHARRSSCLRPLWALGMSLYILSQLLGSTLALRYLRAEYVAPLGATSLIFNFLFASWLVGTPVTKTDIRGTVTVIIGVIGIVVFGSIHSPELSDSVDLPLLKYYWSRATWWGYFLLMGLGTLFTYCWSSMLQSALQAKEDLELPTPAHSTKLLAWFERGPMRYVGGVIRTLSGIWRNLQRKVDRVADASDDKFLNWVLAMGWSCCGGALAGGCLVFAKATVNLLATRGSFLSPASLFTLLLLILTAVTQIVCLNRGLEAWDSTLVVPVFYGIYTSSGFLDSLMFFHETPYFQMWVLVAIFLSIGVLVAGVILLSTKKPDKARTAPRGIPATERERQRDRIRSAARSGEESVALRSGELDQDGRPQQGEVMWELGSVSDEEEDTFTARSSAKRPNGAGEGKGLMAPEEEEDGDGRSTRAFSIRTARSGDAPVVDVPVRPVAEEQPVYNAWAEETGRRE